jgi:NDP-sugar pyrophosphorylase family protein
LTPSSSDARSLRALVLSAGLGTRLRPLTYIRAKAAVPVNGEPLVRRVIWWLAGHGIGDVVVNLHHRPATIAAVLGDGSDLDVRIRYTWEQPVLGSAGGPRRALPLLTDGTHAPFLLVNGDTLTDLDVTELIAAHYAAGAKVTMALIRNPRPDKYGGVVVDQRGRVQGFTRPGAGAESFHFIGVQVVEPDVFADLEDGVPAESVGQVYPRMIANRPGSVAALVCEASFSDIGTPRDCLETSIALAATEGDRLEGGARVSIAKSAVVERSALWDDVSVGAGARLTDCIVGDRVVIAPGARYEGCAIVPAAGLAAGEGDRIDGDLLIRPFERPGGGL